MKTISNWDKITKKDLDNEILKDIRVLGGIQKKQLLKSLILSLIINGTEDDLKFVFEKFKIPEEIMDIFFKKRLLLTTEKQIETSFMEIVQKACQEGWDINKDELAYGFFKIIPKFDNIESNDDNCIIELIPLSFDFSLKEPELGITIII